MMEECMRECGKKDYLTDMEDWKLKILFMKVTLNKGSRMVKEFVNG